MVVQAQRARRDLQRRHDVTALNGFGFEYTSQHGGHVPQSQSDVDDLNSHYFGSYFDPASVTPYTIHYRSESESHSDVPPVGTIYYELGHWCNRGPESMPDDPTDPIAGNDTDLSKYVVYTSLENGGIACADNK